MIGKAVTIRVQRSVFTVRIAGEETVRGNTVVGTSRVEVVIVQRHLSHTAGHAHGEPAAGAFFSQQYIGYCMASFSSREPYLQQRIGELTHLIQYQRTASEKDYYHLCRFFPHFFRSVS